MAVLLVAMLAVFLLSACGNTEEISEKPIAPSRSQEPEVRSSKNVHEKVSDDSLHCVAGAPRGLFGAPATQHKEVTNAFHTSSKPTISRRMMLYRFWLLTSDFYQSKWLRLDWGCASYSPI
jgi:hypothetical protein